MTDTPTNVESVRTGAYTVQLSWSAPASNTPPIVGYEVFYTMSGSDITQSVGTTTNTAISVTIPTRGVIYHFFVVAFSNSNNALPSAWSEISSIDMGNWKY